MIIGKKIKKGTCNCCGNSDDDKIKICYETFDGINQKIFCLCEECNLKMSEISTMMNDPKRNHIGYYSDSKRIF